MPEGLDSAAEDSPEKARDERIRDVGEFELIDRLTAEAGPSPAIVGVGDDTAVLDVPGEDYLLATVDMLVEDVHFRRTFPDPVVVGRRAIAVNVSDIAAMGGRPAYALVSLALPPDLVASYAEDMYRGLLEEARRYGLAIAGGNMTRTSGPICIDVALMGLVAKPDVVLRRGARPGDILTVTGELGESTMFRLAHERGLDSDPKLAPLLTGLTVVPQIDIETATYLSSRHFAHAMLDLSDGLASDLHRLCAASECGAVIWSDRVPIGETTVLLGRHLEEDPLSVALTGGEDYKLMVAMGPEDFRRAKAERPMTPFHAIGRVLSRGEGLWLEGSDRQRQSISDTGWKHF